MARRPKALRNRRLKPTQSQAGPVINVRYRALGARRRRCFWDEAGFQITLYNSPVVITRKIRKVGNSLMIPLPPETISESGFKAGMEVAIGSRPGHVDLDPAGVPDNSLVEFTARFTERYREDLAELADL